MLCQNCESRSERECSYTSRTREYFRALIAPLRFVAERCGYAIAVHGSLKTDIDLLAVPWRDSATSQEYLADQIQKTTEIIIGTARTRLGDENPVQKPCGRLAWSFYLSPHEDIPGPYIDLSVMPPRPISISQCDKDE